jgi:hypothetical protein
MKPKVFCIGFHKTGTTTLEVALKKLGYRVTGSFGTKDPGIAGKVHEMAYEMVEEFDAFEDNPWPILYKELDARFVGSKFILTRRPAEAWIRSQVKDFASTETPMRRWIYGENAGCPDLLVVDLPADASWDKLGAVLGRDVPDEPFPHANKASLSRKLKNWFRKL